jgi:hypothetical protein
LFFGASPLGVKLTSDESAAWRTLPLEHNLFAVNPYIWGLTEKGEWVLILIEIHPGQREASRLRVSQIHYSVSNPLMILTTTREDPRRAYTLLRNVIEDWMAEYGEAFDRLKKQIGTNVAASDRLQ